MGETNKKKLKLDENSTTHKIQQVETRVAVQDDHPPQLQLLMASQLYSNCSFYIFLLDHTVVKISDDQVC